LAVHGEEDQARAVARRLLRAVDRGEQEVLLELLAPDLVRLSTRGQQGPPRISRAALLEATRSAQRGRLPPPRAGDPRDGALGRIPAVPIASFFPRQHIPVGLRGEDLIVQVILHEGERSALLRAVFGWRYRGLIVVRTGSRPLIVGI
jgi:hypothetical protein